MSDPALGTVTWWLALGLLLVNDHLLKGAGLLPAWLTGKLSDLAFLTVAPPLTATALATVMSPAAARRAAWGAVGGGFALINLSPDAAAAVTATGRELLGLRWALTVDPTDLIALAVLPSVLRLGRSTLPAPSGRRPTARTAAPGEARMGWSTRLGIAGSTVACLASPAEPGDRDPGWFTELALWNESPEPVDLQIRWLDHRASCDAHLAEHLPGAFHLDAFSPARTFAVDGDGTLPVDRPAGVPGPGGMPEPAACTALVISGPGLAPQLVFARFQDGADFVSRRTDGEFLPVDTLRLRGGMGLRELTVLRGEHRVEVLPLDATGVRCEPGDALPLEAPGCWRVDLAETAPLDGRQPSPDETIDLCLPDGLAFPFAEGDRLELRTDGTFGVALSVRTLELRSLPRFDPDGALPGSPSSPPPMAASPPRRPWTRWASSPSTPSTYPPPTAVHPCASTRSSPSRRASTGATGRPPSWD